MCQACISGKQSCGPLKLTAHMANVLEVVHADLMGSVHPDSIDGETSALCMLDEYTQYSAVYLGKEEHITFLFVSPQHSRVYSLESNQNRQHPGHVA